MSAPCKSVAGAFLKLWKSAASRTEAEWALALGQTVATTVTQQIAAGLDSPEGGQGALVLLSIAEAASPKSLEVVIAILRAIDMHYGKIHPRTVVPHGMPPVRTHSWLDDQLSNWYSQGRFDDDGSHALVPRGPLTRHARAEDASSAVHYSDIFTYLAVVPLHVMQANRKIQIRMIVLPPSTSSGYVGKNRGEETIAFLPLAEKSDHIEMQFRTVGQSTFVKFGAAKSCAAADLLVKGLERAGVVEVAMAPELIMSESEAQKVADELLRVAGCAHLVIAGSGPTNASEGGLHWNEAVVLNSVGTVLWRQRKIWLAGIQHDKATRLGIPHPGEGQLLHEDNASGSELVVADVIGLGRCVTLICQDFVGDWTEQVVKTYQPDWIFVPILDPGVRVGNWVHQQALSLSRFSHARILVISSTALGRDMSASEPHCAMLVGPLNGAGVDEGRMVAVVATDGRSPGLSLVKWRSGEAHWTKTKIISDGS